MKKIQMLLLLSSTALAAIAFSVPAVASAAEWTQEGAPLEKEELVELEGTIEWEKIFFYGSISCGVNALATLSPGDEGEMVEFNLDPESCQGSVGPCEYQEALASEPFPLQAAIAESKAEVRTGEVAFKLRMTGCSIPGFVPVYEELTLTPDNAAAFSSFSLYGLNTSGTIPITGTLNVTPSEVFGIDE